MTYGTPSFADPQLSVPTAPYSMVAPLLAQQFCQLQTLGHEHRVPWLGIPSAVQVTAASTPLVMDAWEAVLRAHPDRRWVECPLNGIRRHGFRMAS